MAVNFDIATHRVEVNKGYFTVRGLSSEDLTHLTITYLDDMKKVVAQYSDRGIVQRSAVADLVMALAKDFPDMVVEIISRCADSTDPDDIAKFRRLSFVKQVEALKHIALLTVEDGGIELGNVTRVLAAVLEANGLQAGTLTKSLQTIIGASEKA
ncbi:MAG: hypothetical protein ABFE01_10385 [Phycisphaerales bacterium]